jgi:hypothetical protein
LAAGLMSQTPEGFLEDVLEESEEEPEMVSEPVLEVVLEEVPVEGGDDHRARCSSFSATWCSRGVFTGNPCSCSHGRHC